MRDSFTDEPGLPWPTVVAIDVEGSGASPPELIEFAAVSVSFGETGPHTSYSTLIRPSGRISPFARRIHKISDEMVADAPTWDAVRGNVELALQQHWVCGHNVGVDSNLIRRYLPEWRAAGTLDTLRLARALLKNAPNYRLETVLRICNIPDSADRVSHRALGDAQMAAKLLTYFAQVCGSWKQLVLLGSRPEHASMRQASMDTLW